MPAMLSPEDRTMYEGFLRDAQKAMHELSMGGAVRVYVDQNGERIEYTATSKSNLRTYIIELQVKLGLPLSGISGPMRISPW